jgi:tetratricopeptide (TPR) repeat protein
MAAAGDNVQARKHFESAIQFDAKDANAYYSVGKFVAGSGQTDEAIRNLRQAVRLQPAVADFHQALADALWRAGRRDEAVDYYHAALRPKPGFEARYANLAKALAELNRTDEAIATAQDGIKLALTAGQPATASAIEGWLTKYRASMSASSSDEQKR